MIRTALKAKKGPLSGFYYTFRFIQSYLLAKILLEFVEVNGFVTGLENVIFFLVYATNIDKYNTASSHKYCSGVSNIVQIILHYNHRLNLAMAKGDYDQIVHFVDFDKNM